MTINVWGSPTGGGSGGGSSSMPSGYAFRKNKDDGSLELWKTDVTPNVLITHQNVGIFDVNGSIRTLLNTMYLEQSHSISAAGQNVVFKNLTTDISFVPSAYDGHSNEGRSITRNEVQSPNQLQENFNLYGDVDYNNTRDLDYNVVVPFEFNIYKIQYRIAQEYQGNATITITNTAGNVTYRQVEYFDVQDRDLITFGGTYFAMLTGDEFNVKVTDENGDVLLGYQADTETTYPFMMYDIRTFDKLQHLAGIHYINTDKDNEDNTMSLVNRHYMIDNSESDFTYTLPLNDVYHIRITDYHGRFNNFTVTLNWAGGNSAVLGRKGDDVSLFKVKTQDSDGNDVYTWHYHNYRDGSGGLLADYNTRNEPIDNIRDFDTSNYHFDDTDRVIPWLGTAAERTAASRWFTGTSVGYLPYDFSAKSFNIYTMTTEQALELRHSGKCVLKYTHKDIEYTAISSTITTSGTHATVHFDDLFIPHSVRPVLEFSTIETPSVPVGWFRKNNHDSTTGQQTPYVSFNNCRLAFAGKHTMVEVANNDSYDGGDRYFCLLPWNNSNSRVSGVWTTADGGSYTSNPILDIQLFTNAVLSTTDNTQGFTRMSWGITRAKTTNDYGIASLTASSEADSSLWEVPTTVRDIGAYMIGSITNTSRTFYCRRNTLSIHADTEKDSPNEVISDPLMIINTYTVAAKDDTGGGDYRILRVFFQYEYVRKNAIGSLM